MDYESIMSMIEQYKTNGGDVGVIMNGVSALAATGKTPLGLNQWSRSDKPVMEDFNEDNRIVDEKLRELDARLLALDSRILAVETGKADIDGDGIWYRAELNSAMSGFVTYSRKNGYVLVTGQVVHNNLIGEDNPVCTIPSSHCPGTVYATTNFANSNAVVRENGRIYFEDAGKSHVAYIHFCYRE